MSTFLKSRQYYSFCYCVKSVEAEVLSQFSLETSSNQRQRGGCAGGFSIGSFLKVMIIVFCNITGSKSLSVRLSVSKFSWQWEAQLAC